VDQVGEQTSQNSQQINDTRNTVKQNDERAQNGISAATERANSADQHAATADQHAGDAMNKANAATELGNQNSEALASLRSTVANLDDYRMQTNVSVPFGFDKSTLSKEGKESLDKLAGDVKSDKRFFIAVEGYTDSVGSKQYNDALSKRRADTVVNYLVGTLDVPIYRIHMIGLGEQKPVEEGRGKDARAKNRRVEVKVFSADQNGTPTNTDADSANRIKQ
jgi:outer membrane protein OmpA-like peptidoglycan-associated protein